MPGQTNRPRHGSKKLVILALLLSVFANTDGLLAISAMDASAIYNDSVYYEGSTTGSSGTGSGGISNGGVGSCSGIQNFPMGSDALKNLFFWASERTGVPSPVLAAQSLMEAGVYWNAEIYTDQFVTVHSITEGGVIMEDLRDMSVDGGYRQPHWYEAPALGGKLNGPTGPMQLDQFTEIEDANYNQGVSTPGSEAGNFDVNRLNAFHSMFAEFGGTYPLHGEVAFDSAIAYAAVVDLYIAKSRDDIADDIGTLEDAIKVLDAYGTLRNVSDARLQEFKNYYAEFYQGCTTAASLESVILDVRYTDRQDMVPETIILHWWAGTSGGNGIETLINALATNSGCQNGCSVQFGVLYDGRTYQLSEKPDVILAHAPCVNGHAIGIEIEGGVTFENGIAVDLKRAMDDPQFAAVVNLVIGLMEAYNIPLDGPITYSNELCACDNKTEIIHAVGVHSHKEVQDCMSSDCQTSFRRNKIDVDDDYLARVKDEIRARGY